jgi:pimeloyl-ACP methyl ester carboxylesterase
MTAEGVPSVVLVHALRTSSTMWRGQRATLEARGYRVHTPDLPGHGGRMGERFTVEGALEAIADAVRAADAEGEGGVFLGGLSLGGYLALHYAGAEPGRLRGLLLASCGTQPYKPVLEAWRLAARVIARFPDRGRALNDFAVRLAVRDPALAEDVARGGIALDVMDDVLRELATLDVRASLARVDAPVWFVNGQWDHFRLEERRALRAASNARLVRIVGANHLVNLSRPGVFDRVLVTALDSV